MKHSDKDYIAHALAFVLALTAFYFTYQIHLIFATITMVTTYFIIYGILYFLLPTKKKKTTKKITSSNNKKKVNTTSSILRSDEEILLLPIESLSWKEFERLIFLYYQSKGYHPVATKDGADGGVDLLYNHPQHKNKVAVQIKHWNKPVGVNYIRELDSVKKITVVFLLNLLLLPILLNLQKMKQINLEWKDMIEIG